MGRAIAHAQANGLPLEALEGHDSQEVFGVGLGAVIHGITLDPADAWAWSNLATLYEGYRSARVRLEKMRRAGEMAMGFGSEEQQEEGLEPEDILAAAANMMARSLEPNFFYYDDALAKNLTRDRGLVEQAGREIADSFALVPRLQSHPILEVDSLLDGLGDRILEGVVRAESNAYVSPVSAMRARSQLLVRLDRKEEAIRAYTALRSIGDWTLRAESDLEIGETAAGGGTLPRESAEPECHPGERDRQPLGAVGAVLPGCGSPEAGRTRSAAGFLSRFLAMTPEQPTAYWSLAEALEGEGKLEEAEGLYVAAVRRFPDNPGAYEKVIGVLRRRGKLDQALAYAEGYRKVDPASDRPGELLRQLRSEAAGTAP